MAQAQGGDAGDAEAGGHLGAAGGEGVLSEAEEVLVNPPMSCVEASSARDRARSAGGRAGLRTTCDC